MLPAFILGSSALLPSSASAQCNGDDCGFSTCSTPAFAADSALWGELQPAVPGQLPINRDTTGFNGVGSFEVNPYWQSLDPENGWLFSVADLRFQIWDITSNPASPTAVEDAAFSQLGLSWTPDAHAFDVFTDIDAPEGNSNLVAVSGRYGMGMAVFDTTVKDSPVIRYQDVGLGLGRWADAVYSTRINGRDYAFVGAEQDTGGAFVYDLTEASQLGSTCVEQQPGDSTPCSNVFLGQLGSRITAFYIDGVGDFVALSSTVFPRGFEIWNVSNPASPSKVMDALSTTGVYALSMFLADGEHYIAMRTTSDFRIYNVECITNGSCSPGSPVWSRTLPSIAGDTMVTDSISGGQPFLYIGTDSWCIDGNQHEWVYDVSNPANPRDITPPNTSVVNGESVSYWGWYYRPNGVHGFNRVKPRMAKFAGDYLYRAANSILDVHQRVGVTAPTANFDWSPNLVYPGTLIDFNDLSQGAPSSWAWTFSPDGNPGSSNARNPSGVAFPSTGTKTISLTASNSAGNDSESMNLEVLSPDPVVASVSASPNPALLCQPITFTAQGVTGQPPLEFAWRILQDGTEIDTGGDVNPFVWTSGPGASTAATFTAEVTVSNGGANDAVRTSPGVSLQPLAALPAAGTFTPTYVGAPDPPTQPEVQFQLNVAGATEWNWDFGDGSGFQGWTSDPVSGPNPTFTYQFAGIYSVQVQVRNCAEGARTSATLELDMTNSTPLIADFEPQIFFCQPPICQADTNDPITFTDKSSGSPQSWDYDWNGDGNFEDTDNAAAVTSHSYSSAGVYRPRLRVRRPGIEDIDTTDVLINVGGQALDPRLQITGATNVQVGDETDFFAIGFDCLYAVDGWSWSTDGGGASTNGPDISLSWSSPGVKTVEVTNSGCAGITGELTVNVNGTPPEELFVDGFETGTVDQWTLHVGGDPGP
ncbi:MAG: PKD domain-containing protein [Acidobacteriota bacterium]